MADAELAILPALTPSPATVAAAVVPAAAAGTSREAPAASARPLSRKQYNAAMKWVRRLHLYAGLLLTPWVFLYGVTAFLFNHPSAFPDQEIRTIGAGDTAETPLAGFPRAEDLAARVVAALNVRDRGEGDPASYTLIRPDETAYTSALLAQARGEGRQHTVRIDLESDRGSVRSATAANPASRGGMPPAERAPFASREPVDVADAPTARIKDGVPALLARLGLPADDVTIRTPPELAFYLKGEGDKTWKATYNLQTGAVTGRPADVPASESGPGMSTRRMLLRLHTTHGYSDNADARWGWALAVDAMAFAMVGWATSGLLMWWQMKNVRGIGAVMLIISAVLASAVTVGMTAHLRANAGARGEGAGGAGLRGAGPEEGAREGGRGGEREFNPDRIRSGEDRPGESGRRGRVRDAASGDGARPGRSEGP